MHSLGDTSSKGSDFPIVLSQDNIVPVYILL